MCPRPDLIYWFLGCSNLSFSTGSKLLSSRSFVQFFVCWATQKHISMRFPTAATTPQVLQNLKETAGFWETETWQNVTFYMSAYCPHSVGITRQLRHSHLWNLLGKKDNRSWFQCFMCKALSSLSGMYLAHSTHCRRTCFLWKWHYITPSTYSQLVFRLDAQTKWVCREFVGSCAKVCPFIYLQSMSKDPQSRFRSSSTCHIQLRCVFIGQVSNLW